MVQWRGKAPLHGGVCGQHARPQNLYSPGQKGGRALWGQGDHLCRRPGDVKSHQIQALGERQFHYLTAITKPQIEALLKSDALQLDLFDETLAEITTAPRRAPLPVKTNIKR